MVILPDMTMQLILLTKGKYVPSNLSVNHGQNGNVLDLKDIQNYKDWPSLDMVISLACVYDWYKFLPVILRHLM